MTEDLRRNACPSLEAPMQTGDGLLIRLHLIAPADPAEFARLCDLASEHGNGIFEVTSRGSLQFRGFDEASAKRFAYEVAALSLPLNRDTVVETGPFSHEQTTRLAEEIRKALLVEELTLAPKFAIAVNDGSVGAPSDVPADVRIDPCTDGRWRVAIAGTSASARGFMHVDAREISGCVVAICSDIAALGPLARGRDLPSPDTISQSALASQGAESPVGVFSTGAGFALGLRLSPVANDTKAFAKLCRSLAGEKADLRFGANKAIYFAGAKQICAKLLQTAKNLGFVVDKNDPRLAIDACAGAPACASAHYATKDLAREIAGAAPSLFDGSVKLHLSGCEKRCACRDEKDLLLVGIERGLALSFDGQTLDHVDESQASDALSGLQTFVGGQRRAGETARMTMMRLGPTGLTAAFKRN